MRNLTGGYLRGLVRSCSGYHVLRSHGAWFGPSPRELELCMSSKKVIKAKRTPSSDDHGAAGLAAKSAYVPLAVAVAVGLAAIYTGPY